MREFQCCDEEIKMFCTIGSDGKGNIKDVSVHVHDVFKKVLDKERVCLCARVYVCVERQMCVCTFTSMSTSPLTQSLLF